MKINSIEEDVVIPKKAKKENLVKGIITTNQSRESAKAYVITPQNMARRYSSEKKLEELIDWDFAAGNSYHVISQGDIDSLTFLRHIIKQQHIKEVIISTWCMGISDILEIESWIKVHRIDFVHFYVGEIFKASYAGEYEELKKLQKEGKANVSIFRNHSKVMCGHGDKFSFVIESSANINTNPRCENTVITCDHSLTDFYINFYKDIISIDR